MQRVLTDTGGIARASVWRRAVPAWLIGCALALGLAIPSAAATGGPPVVIAADTTTAPRTMDAVDEPPPSEQQPWLALLVVTAAGAALLAVLGLSFRRNLARLGQQALRPAHTRPEDFFGRPHERDRSPRARRRTRAAPVPLLSFERRPPPRGRSAAPAEHAPTSTLPPAGQHAAPAPAPSHEANGAGPPGNGRVAAEVCQVRWIPRRSRFYAVSVDGDGVEHRIAVSPRIDSPGPAPPDPTPEAQRAMRLLAQDLREGGWTALRAKGRDHGEPRWYARRFKRTPAEATPLEGTPTAMD